MTAPKDDHTPPPLQQRQTYYGDPASQVEGCARLAAFLATLIGGALILPPILGGIAYLTLHTILAAILGGVLGFVLAVVAAIIVLKRG